MGGRRPTDRLKEMDSDLRMIEYIDPGSPGQNGHSESFNAVFRDGCLDRWLFYSVQEARRVINSWLDEYNIEHPMGPSLELL